jgi:anthranilate phosphoribosyltransferase
VAIDLAPEHVSRCIAACGIGFMFAPRHHLAMKYVAPVRRELGVRTVFNLLGPLTNPAAARTQVMGVYAEALVEPLAHVLCNLGVTRGMVVYGQDKLDELSLSAPTTVCEFQDGGFRTCVVCPEDVGLARCDKNDLTGGTPEENAAFTRAILAGEKGPKRDAVLLNAGAGLYAGGKAATLSEGVRLAARLIDGGDALRKLSQFVEASNRTEESA